MSDNNKNSVEFIGYYGSDITHACSAWTSTSRELTEDKTKRIPALLKRLATEGHHTPFEKSALHFLLVIDNATHIQLLKHRIGVSVNGESARYKELTDKHYLPDDWDVEIKSLEGLPQRFGKTWVEALDRYTEIGDMLYHSALEDLEPVVGRKRAKESARFFKPYNSQLTFDVMFNWRSFVHFLGLRNKEDAQKEIREISAEMLRLVENIPENPFKYTIEAFEL